MEDIRGIAILSRINSSGGREGLDITETLAGPGLYV